jgi:DNA-binding protein Fis
MVYGYHHCCGSHLTFFYIAAKFSTSEERIFMKARKASSKVNDHAVDTTMAVVEDVIEKKLCDITTILYSKEGGKSRLYEHVLAMVERSLFKIALQRNNNAKGAAAAYLGINRNTFQKKMVKLGINNTKE